MTQIQELRHMIRKIINTDTATRLGIFNKIQQDEIIAYARTLNLDQHLDDAISNEIEQQVAPWIRAVVAIIRIRKNAVKSNKKVKEFREKAEKIPQLPLPNIFDNFPPEEVEEPQHPPVIRILHGKERTFAVCLQTMKIAMILWRSIEPALGPTH